MKTFIQKGFEKAVMLERNSDLSLALAKDERGDTILVIGLGSMSSSFTPLAKLLPSNEIDSMTPLKSSSTVLDEWFKKVRGTLEGENGKDFEANIQHPELTEEAIDRYLPNIQ